MSFFSLRINSLLKSSKGGLYGALFPSGNLRASLAETKSSFGIFFFVFFLQTSSFASVGDSIADTSAITKAGLLIDNRNLPINNEYLLPYDRVINTIHINFHTSVKPYLGNELLFIPKFSGVDESYTHFSENKNKLFFSIHSNLNLTTTYGSSQSKVLSGNYSGLTFLGSIGGKLSFQLNSLWGYSQFPDYIKTLVNTTHVVPGIGLGYQQKNSFYSFQNYSGYVSYSPNKIFNFQAGKDKHFWGDGYRSLFLSDFAPNYPFLKITTTVWKIKYVNMYAMHKDATTPTQAGSKNKYATFHYLSWNVCKRFNMSLFESIVWQGTDSNRVRHFDVNYLNPMIFYRPVEYSLGSSDNAFLGWSFKWNFFKKQQLYGQVLLDEFLLSEIRKHRGWWANKQSFQLGIKSYDLFKIKDLDLQLEGNYVRPYTYSHGSVQQNYGHYNYSLAHPLGANFIEGIAIVNYRHKKFGFRAEVMYVQLGKDSAGKNMGGNIFESYSLRARDYSNYTTQGIKTTLVYTDLRVTYDLVKQYHLVLEAGISNRMENSALSKYNSTFIYVGLRSNLQNLYRDF